MIPIVTPIKIKGKIYVKMLLQPKGEPQVLSAQFSSIAQVKRVTEMAGYQYCTPAAFKVLFG